INATLYDKLNFVFLRDIAAVAGIISLPFVMVVNPSVPAKTVPAFTAYAKANPGKINLGSPGIGTPGHVAGELFKMMAGVDLVHVPYRGGGPVMTDLLGGQVQVLFGSTSLTIEQIRAGKLRPLAVTSATRWGGLPGPAPLKPSAAARPRGPPRNVLRNPSTLRTKPGNVLAHTGAIPPQAAWMPWS